MRAGHFVRAVGLAALLITETSIAKEDAYPRWDGWIVGKPCAEALRIIDCPLRLVDEPVLLLESGEVLTFRYGQDSPIRQMDLDKAYGKKVRIAGNVKEGVIQSIRMDLLEVSGERKFFKGCL